MWEPFYLRKQSFKPLQQILKMKEVQQKSIEGSHNNSATQCIICCERQANATTNVCAHRFCDICILKWSKSKRTCPVCRKVYTGVKYSKKINKHPANRKYIVQHKAVMLNYGLACSNYVNVSNSVVPVFSIVPYMYAVDSYYIM